MVSIYRRLRDEGRASRLVLQVHDELVFEAPRGEVDRLAVMVHEEMDGVVQLAVPIETSISWGDDWASAK